MKRGLIAAVGALAMTAAGTGVAFADKDNGAPNAFLCPIVGEGVLNAPGTGAFLTPAGPSLLPGKNRAGTHANANALNENGGPVAGNSPGADGFTPIWNP
ncbi:MAG: hypothetical protein FJZ92_03060 [Chloroflexi bacterium]|nr:hypothetical protein [Chloroflexota bacterium]